MQSTTKDRRLCERLEVKIQVFRRQFGEVAVDESCFPFRSGGQGVRKFSEGQEWLVRRLRTGRDARPYRELAEAPTVFHAAGGRTTAGRGRHIYKYRHN
jgi:hypothetical protein